VPIEEEEEEEDDDDDDVCPTTSSPAIKKRRVPDCHCTTRERIYEFYTRFPLKGAYSVQTKGNHA